MNYRFAPRMEHMRPSGIREIFERAARMKNPANLSIGQADFDTPELAKDAAIAAIRAGHNKYTLTQGIGPLRERVSKWLRERLGVTGGDTVITSGVSGALLPAIMALIGPGDEVMIPDPYFVMYKYLTAMAGGTAVPYDTYPDFVITQAALEKAVTPRTRVIIVNSPSNPTGHVASRAELETVARFAAKNNLIVISDEIYELFVYDPARPHISIRTMYPHTLLMGGFSKSWAMPGWRLGWVNAPEEITQRMKTIQQFSFVCGPSPLQEGALAAMDVDMSPQIAEYRKKRDLVVETLSPHFDLVKPEGTFYAFPKCPWGTDREFVEAALARELVIIHGSACSERGTHFRLSFAVNDATLKRGLSMLVDLAKNGA